MFNSMPQLAPVLSTLVLVLSGILALFMVTGLTLWQAGLVRSQNTVDILVKNLILLAISCVVFLICGGHLFFGETTWLGILPGFVFHFGSIKGAQAIFFLQFIAAAIVMSYVAGATAERIKPWALFLFAVVMVGFIYPVLGYWVWHKGFLQELGFIDMAGAGTIHLAGGASALAVVMLIGARQGRYADNGEINPQRGANLPLAALGGFLMWIGFIGLNLGGALMWDQAKGLAFLGSVAVNVCVAGAFGLLAAMLLARILAGTLDLSIMLNGAIAGMVAISAFPITTLASSVGFIGAIAGILVVFAVRILDRFKLDDPMGIIASNLVGGVWGLLAVACTGLYGDLENFSIGTSGWFSQFMAQIFGIIIIFAWVFALSFGVCFLLRYFMGLRIGSHDEHMGLDARDCGMDAYPEFIKTRVHR